MVMRAVRRYISNLVGAVVESGDVRKEQSTEAKSDEKAVAAERSFYRPVPQRRRRTKPASLQFVSIIQRVTCQVCGVSDNRNPHCCCVAVLQRASKKYPYPRSAFKVLLHQSAIKL